MEKLEKAIGGYFELELRSNSEYYPKAISLNTARNALEYILKVRQYTKIYIPFFTCDVILEPIKKLNITYEFYHINRNLEPVFDYKKIISGVGFLYTNYFGLKDDFVKDLTKKVPNLIIDNAQSFFSEPNHKIDTFYSPRKFFGVCDGAYLFCDEQLNQELEQDKSFDRMSHLLIRSDLWAEAGYSEFLKNDKDLANKPIKKMSNLTHKLLGSINYEFTKTRRIQNFNYLHKFLKNRNLLKFENFELKGPMVYPFWIEDATIKRELIDNKIFCATYWPNVTKWCKEDSLESNLTKELIHLPIDQRYNIEDMDKILKVCLKF